MGDLAYLVPVGPFAGLSNTARHEISKHFPTLSFAEIENAAGRFALDLEAPFIEPRLCEARDELNSFGKELARFLGAVERIRKHQLDRAIEEASRRLGGENELENLERALGRLRTAWHETSRVLPVGRAQLASRRLIAMLAAQMKQAGLPVNGRSSEPLLSLVSLIFDDLMIGGNAESVVTEWRKSQEPPGDQVGRLIDLVVP